MFSDWPSELVPQQGWGDEAAISAFKDAIPWTVGRDFVAGTAKHLAGSLGLTKPGPPIKSKIVHDKQLQVLMPALGHGLSFPLSEIDILRDCVSVYCEWLSALLPNPKSSVPGPILSDPNHYARIIINHFYYLFVPRGAQGPDVINRQAVLCHRVLRTLQNIAQNSPCLSEDTWQTLLLFLLHINSALLSPPTIKEDAGEQLCERVLSVLFETWLLACARCFPPPPLWNALRESCQRWRHRVGLIDQWNRINFALTRKLIGFMYGPSFPEITISAEDDLNIIPTNMSRDCIAQVWYRILHIIGNPVDLSRHTVISKTPAFLKYAISSALVIEPSQHPCLQMLPSIFLSAMKGVSGLVDAFLGVPNTSLDNLNQKGRQISPSSSFSLSAECRGEDAARLLANGRPKCNSILHLFGPWLFEAALINCNLQASPGPQHKSDVGSNAGSGSRRPVSVFAGEGSRKSSDSSAPGDSHADRLANLTPQHFQSGRAEALGALCRIFCSKKTGEEILPVYLARFYIALHQGLRQSDPSVSASHHESGHSSSSRSHGIRNGICSETAASILVNGVDLFRLDLQGVVSLVPSVLGVLECVLPEGELNAPSHLPVTLLRRAATHVLLSILPLPLHFQGLQVKEVGSNSGERLALSHLRPQLVNLLTSALQVETDPANTQMLLGGLLFCVQDAALCEVMDSISQHNFSTDRDHNIMSSGMNTKTKTLLWLFDKCPPIFSVPGNHGFTGPYPPTGEQVLLQYHGYHKQLQQASHLQSSALDAARLVTKDLQDWWVNTGITLKSWQAIEQMILTDIKEYKLRKSKRNRTTDTETKKREEFLVKTRQTFWIVQREFEKRLAAKQQLEKQDQTDKEDWLYLEGVRGVTRTATLGPRDQKLAKRQKRKFLDQQAAQERKAKDCLRSATAAHSADAVEESHDPESEDSTEIPMHTVSVSLPKVSKKMEGVPMEACFIADKYAISNRAVTELAAAFRKDGGKNLEEYNLSVNTTGRSRQSARLEKAADITKWQLGDITSKMYALHWDGKLIKSLMHVGKDMERVAVILTGTDGQEVLLSIVGMEGRSTAENEAAKIIQVLNDHPLDTSRIGALVFDTTAVNSGVWSGVVVRLETEFGRSLLQLACRHHIHELIGGASCSIVYGPTTGPNEQLFKRLVNNWSELNHNNYSLVEVTAPQRELMGYIHNTITFLQTWIENSTKETLRHDYLELAELTLLFLGGTVPAGRRSITIKAPGAFHHARWISKTLYTFKVALFRCQLGDVYAPEELEDITSLAVFLAIFYTKAWLTCTSAADAPSNDLALMKNLLKAEASISKDPMKWPAKFLSFVVPARQKLQKHLWYLSERLVSLALFSDRTSSDKQTMRKAMLRYHDATDSPETRKQEMPASHQLGSKALKDFIGHDSWSMFELLGIDSSFVKLPVAQWTTSDNYRHGKKVVANLPVVNDAAERALGLATDLNTNKAPKSEEQLQALYRVVKGVREKLHGLATSTEVVTKKSLASVSYSWD